MQDMIIDFVQIFEVMIITSSICLVEIIRHWITYSTCCIEAFYKVFNGPKNRVPFSAD